MTTTESGTGTDTGTGTGLAGKVALVIGGGRGIGAAAVEALARQDATVVVADTDRLPSAFNHYRSTRVSGFADAQKLAARLSEAGLRVTAAEVDATDEAAVRELYGSLAGGPGRLDVVVNAFGVTHVSPVEQMELTEFQQVVSGNLDGVFLSSKHAVPLLRDSGGGAIINFSSVSGRSGFAKVAHYCAAKAGVIGFSSSLALEVARDGIRVNAICPGMIRTNMWSYLLSAFVRPGETEDECWERMRTMIPQREFQTPEDIAELVVFLATAKKVTGQAISVDGGMTA